MIRCLLALAALLGHAQGAAALELTLPNSARQTVGEERGISDYALPTAPFDGETIPSRGFEGYVTRQVWRIEGGGITPLQLVQPLREELRAEGYTVIFECADRDCGGFDFRFATEVVNAPDMFVDLDDYRFVSALKGPSDAPTAALSLMVSRSAAAAYVQITQIAVDKGAEISVAKGSELVASTDAGVPPASKASLAKQLDVAGHVILSDLVFETGSSDLGAGPFASLAELADFLKADANRRIALVGHTDAVGSLDGNVALSKRRAASVRARLIEAYGINADQLSAEGVGFLAPVASNLSKQGREANRRVEAVLVNTK